MELTREDLLNEIRFILTNVELSNTEALRDALNLLPCTLDKLSTYVPEPTTLPYGRAVLFVSQDVEAVLLNFPPLCQTAIHDHGFSCGYGKIIHGELEEICYQLGSYGFANETRSQRFHSGEGFQMKQGVIHSLRNPGTERLITFHLYAPALQAVKRYVELPLLDYVI